MQVPDTEWIFFACFNTLIDDFDPAGEEGGLCSIPEQAAALGYFPTAEDFRAVYRTVRAQASRLGQEVPLVERVRQTLAGAPPGHSRDAAAAAAAQLVKSWENEYMLRLRPAPGVEAMLLHWAPRRSCAIVTNSYVPALPAHALEHFGLGRYFRFILDSAGHGHKNPNPLLLMEGLSQARLGPCDGARVLMVSDRYDTDLMPALDLGMPVLYFDRRQLRPGVPPPPEGIPSFRDWDEFR